MTGILHMRWRTASWSPSHIRTTWYHKGIMREGLLAAYRAYPDMTVFTTDYVIVKNGRLITGDAMLWVKRILRSSAPRVPAPEPPGVG